jgi:hypothetical protein
VSLCINVYALSCLQFFVLANLVSTTNSSGCVSFVGGCNQFLVDKNTYSVKIRFGDSEASTKRSKLNGKAVTWNETFELYGLPLPLENML